MCADLARQVVADGEGITVLAEINVTGAVDDAQAKAIARRIATSPLVKTALFGHDANWGRVLMAAGSRAVERRLRGRSTPTRITLRYNGTVVLDQGAPTDVEPDVSGPSCTIDLDLGLGAGQGGLPDERPLLRLRPHQRGLPDMSRLVVKVGGAVAARVGGRTCSSSRATNEVCVVHGAGPQISARDGARRASRSSSSAAGA